MISKITARGSKSNPSGIDAYDLGFGGLTNKKCFLWYFIILDFAWIRLLIFSRASKALLHILWCTGTPNSFQSSLTTYSASSFWTYLTNLTLSVWLWRLLWNSLLPQLYRWSCIFGEHLGESLLPTVLKLQCPWWWWPLLCFLISEES